MKNLMKKKVLLHTICAIILAMVFFMSAQTAYADVLFEHRESESLAPGVHYERILRMTERGLLDIHVLTVPLNDPNIYIGPVASQQHGLKETTTNLLSGADAVAGINADFFGLAGSHSVHFGPMVMDGELLGLNPHTNRNRNEFAAFFLDSNNNPFFDYMQAEVRFYNNGARNISIASFNMIGLELNFPVVIDRNLMETTLPITERFGENLTKIIVHGNVITQITQGYVEVPTNGYVVILPRNIYRSYGHLFSVGDSAHLHIGNNLGIDFSRMQAAIGGGGMILSAGETVYGSGVAPNARHPRSAIGVSRDGNRLILMVVDGRNHSIGATQVEMADLLREFGAWDAMHFDGGGSSTMAYREIDGRYTVANTPSDGAQRRVINALGVFDTRPFVPQEIYVHVPPLAQLIANQASIALYREGQSVSLRFSGVAADGNFIPYIPIHALTQIYVPYNLGRVENGRFIAGSGSGVIVASVNGINTYIPVTIGGEPQVFNIHRGGHSFVGYPADVSGNVVIVGHHVRLNYDFAASAVTQAAHVAFSPALSLPSGVVALNLEVRGDNSGHWLRGRIRDGDGRHHIVDFTSSIDFTNWQTLTAVLPGNLPGPLVLERVYAVALNSAAASSHNLTLGRVETIVAPPIVGDIPEGPVFRDWLWAERGFVGKPAGRNYSFALPYRGTETEYSVDVNGSFTVATMTLEGRRLGNEQWGQFLDDIRSTSPSYVVILMDDNPQRGFRHTVEFELFHLALETLRDEGRMIFVVSNTGPTTTATVHNSIRYINLAQGRDSIHFRISGNEIWWTD